MKITDIKQQVKRSDRYSIYVDDQYVFSFSENELMSLRLRIGQEFTAEGLAELKKTAVEDKAWSRSIDLLARRMRSVGELRDYLKRKDYEPDIIDKTLSRLSVRGYIDDYKFAETWVSNRRLLKAISKRRLQVELKQKRISSDIIDEVLAEDETDERQVIHELIAKKLHQAKYQDPIKLMQYLSRQGFSYDDIKAALHREGA